jgi:acyl-homoserine-lactone acylase
MKRSNSQPAAQVHGSSLTRRALLRGAGIGGAAALIGAVRPVGGRAIVVGTTSVGAPGPSSAELLWDTWGVPHIFADDDVDLFYAFGWAQMHSHGDLILRLYGQGRGRMAEYWGEEYVEIDRATRLLGIPGLGAEWTKAQSPAFRANLDAFVAGMNAYAQQHPGTIGEEFAVALPIEGADVLRHMARVMAIFITATSGVAEVVPGLSFEGQPGSNAWAIGPARSASGNALLLANPHILWSGFTTLYEAQLTSPGYDAYGATIVGFPVLAFAFNDALGWTHTVNTFDGGDLYELTLTTDGYRFDGADRAFETETQVLKVKQADGALREEPFLLRRSVHGPVVEHEGKTLALRLAGVDRWSSAAGLAEQWWEMGRATDLTGFEAALRRMQLPMFNVLYADRDGHVLSLFAGHVPVRATGDWDSWSGLVPGDTSATLWTQIHPYDDLPRVLDPLSGWVQNTNDQPWTGTVPPALRPQDFPPYLAPGPGFAGFRTQRSLHLLAEDEHVTLDELVAYQSETRMEMADRILDDLLAAAREHGGELTQRAGDVLERWDRRADADSRGAVLFAAWAQAALERDGESLVAVPWSEQAPLTTPDGLANPRAAVALLDEVSEQVEAAHGRLDVAWGEVYRLRAGTVDLPASGGPGELGLLRVLNFAPGQDEHSQAVFGDTYVAAVEFADPVQAQVLLTYGNASQPGSPHVGDQLALFARKEMRQAWRTREEIEAHLEARELLTAGGESPAGMLAP